MTEPNERSKHRCAGGAHIERVRDFRRLVASVRHQALGVCPTCHRPHTIAEAIALNGGDDAALPSDEQVKPERGADE